MIGATIEWYDFYLYATASALVFKRLFFPHISPTAGTLASFATYAAGFGARPIGAIVSGHFGDRLGRKTVLVGALVLMGLVTAAIGVLPTYAEAGLLAPALLATLRVAQGLAVGAEWGGAAVLSVEHAPPDRRGPFGSFTQLGSPAGMLLATSVFYLTRKATGASAFLAFGWRIPLLRSVFLVLIGLLVRLRLTDAEVFNRLKQRGERARLPVLEVLRTAPRSVLITNGLRISQVGLFVLLTTYSLTYLSGFVRKGLWQGGRRFDHGADIVCRRPGQHSGLGAAVGSGRALATVSFRRSDFRGGPDVVLRGRRNRVGDCRGGRDVFGVNVVHDSMFGPQAAWFAELFDTRVRYSGSSLGYSIGAVLSGGFSPLIAAALLAVGSGRPWLIVGYFAVLSAITFAAAYAATETRGNIG
jgi:MFS family permease